MIEEGISEKSEEDGEKVYWKVYELNCTASYIKMFSLIFALFGLLF